MKLVIGSRNLHKIREIRSILKPAVNADILSLRDFPDYVPPEETGTTFEENAKLKALHASKELQTVVIADDSGLVIPSLDGQPGVKSARFAGENASDKENRKKLIELLANLPEGERVGYFECCMVLANPEGVLKTVSGLCEGKLILEEKGGQGFGYDPLFIKWDYNKTFAELEEDIKNRVSHRRKALDKLLYTLNALSH